MSINTLAPFPSDEVFAEDVRYLVFKGDFLTFYNINISWQIT